MTVLKKFGIGSSFLQWIAVVQKNLEPCVANANTSKPQLKLH